MSSDPEKPSKVGRTSEAENGDTLMSTFHDSILCHILSFMPTKDAARTSILSKRWKLLFLDVPKLAFSDDDVSNLETFTEFVNRRLMLCKKHTSIAEFRIVLRKLPEITIINLWIYILTLLFRNLRVLKIQESEFIRGTPQSLPSEIFGWETLVVLKLRGINMVLKFPESVSFPNLKVLRLERLKIQSETKYLRFDQQGYPLLKYLQLTWVGFDCSNESFLGFGIFLSSLISLVLEIHRQNLVRNVDIHTPSLRQLKYNVWEVDNVTPVLLSFCKSEHLMSADLFSEFNQRDLHNELLSKTSGVKDLCLFRFDAKHLTYSLPHFANLRNLELLHVEVEPMLSVLQSAPRLEVLILEPFPSADVSFVPPPDVPLCLAQKLTKITLSDFARGEICTEKDVGLVRFFLQHGAALERLILEQTPVTREWRISTFEQILNLPRRSPKCVIEVPKETEEAEDGN